MAFIEIPDFDQVSSGREPIPAGRYTVKIVGAEQRTSNEGSPYIRWEAEIIGVDDPENTKVMGRHIFWNTSLKPEALWNVKRLLEALRAPFHPNGFSTDDVLGLTCDVTLREREYQGSITYEVEPNYYPASQ